MLWQLFVVPPLLALASTQITSLRVVDYPDRIDLPFRGYRLIGYRWDEIPCAAGELHHRRVEIRTDRMWLKNVIIHNSDAAIPRDANGNPQHSNVIQFVLCPQDALELVEAREAGRWIDVRLKDPLGFWAERTLFHAIKRVAPWLPFSTLARLGAARESGSPLPPPPPGLRAVGVRVNSVPAGLRATGRIRADIYWHSSRAPADADPQLLLKNVPVLGIQTVRRTDLSGAPVTYEVVVVALSPEDALRPDLARDRGRVDVRIAAPER
jgi:hypothetical protein